MKAGQNVCLNNNIVSKTRSQGQILEKKKKKKGISCRGHTFCHLILKLRQNVCLDDISDVFEND